MAGADRSVWPRRASRAIVATFGFALLFTASVPIADPAVASDLSAQISTARRNQQYFGSIMRSQDRQLVRIQRQRAVSKRNLKRAVGALKGTRKRHAGARRIASVRMERLATVEAMFPDAALAPDPKAYKERLRKLRRDLRIAVTRRQALGKQVRRITWAKRARQRRIAGLKRLERATVGRREAAEGGLGASIVSMTRLAQLRAEIQTSLTLTADGSTFAWPSTGRISQRFGCTGVRFNPSRGSCRHFHDGIDIVAGYGSPVRAAAIGVVAYVGWNPWDERGRAFIVVVGHPDGYVTRYGHLLPSRNVRAGQLVKKGQRIGRMGNTGFSTGTHLHMELLRGSTPVDPVAYFPSSMAPSKPTRRSNDKTSRARQQRAEKRAKEKRAEKRRRQAKRAKAKRTRQSRQQARQRATQAAAPSGSALLVQPPFPALAPSCEAVLEAEAGPDPASLFGGRDRQPATDLASHDTGDCDAADPVAVDDVVEPSVVKPSVVEPSVAVPGDPMMPIRGTSPVPH